MKLCDAAPGRTTAMWRRTPVAAMAVKDSNRFYEGFLVKAVFMAAEH